MYSFTNVVQSDDPFNSETNIMGNHFKLEDARHAWMLIGTSIITYIIYMANYRLIWGWYTYYLEYVKAYTGISRITLRECELVLKERDIWNRAMSESHWFLRQKFEGAIFGTIADGDILAQFLSFVGWILILSMSKLYKLPFAGELFQWIYSSVQLVEWISYLLIEQFQSAVQYVCATATNFIYDLASDITSFRSLTLEWEAYASNAEHCISSLAWFFLPYLSVTILTLLALLTIYHHFGETEIIKTLKNIRKTLRQSIHQTRTMMLEAHAIVTKWIHTGIKVAKAMVLLSRKAISLALCWAHKHSIFLVAALAEAMLLTKYSMQPGTVLHTMFLSAGLVIFAFPNALYRILRYPYDNLARSMSYMLNNDQKEMNAAAFVLGKVFRGIITISTSVFQVTHWKITTDSIVYQDAPPVDLSLWLFLLWLPFSYCYIHSFDGASDSPLNPEIYVSLMILEMTGLFSILSSVFTFAAHSIGVDGLGNTWQYLLSREDNSLLTILTIFIWIYIIFLTECIIVIFSHVLCNAVFSQLLAKILLYVTGVKYFVYLSPSDLYIDYDEELRRQRVPAFSWASEVRACVMIAFAIYGLNLYLAKIDISIFIHDWKLQAGSLAVLITAHNVVSRWSGRLDLLKHSSACTTQQWIKLLSPILIIIGQVLLSVFAIRMLNGIFELYSDPLRLSFSIFSLFWLINTYITESALTFETKAEMKTPYQALISLAITPGITLVLSLLKSHVPRMPPCYTAAGTGSVWSIPSKYDLLTLIYTMLMNIAPIMIYAVLLRSLVIAETIPICLSRFKGIVTHQITKLDHIVHFKPKKNQD